MLSQGIKLYGVRLSLNFSIIDYGKSISMENYAENS